LRSPSFWYTRLSGVLFEAASEHTNIICLPA
jgi:hypothetical protein